MEFPGSQSDDDDSPISRDELILEQEDSSSFYQQSSGSSSEDTNQGDQSYEHQASKKPDRIHVVAEDILSRSTNSSGLSLRRSSKKLYTDDQIRSDAAKWAADFEGPQEVDEVVFQGVGSASRSTPKARGASSKKRKAEIFATKIPKAKRLKGRYCDEYRQLLNATIIQSKRPDDSETHNQLSSSQIGITYWTLSEKEAFFNALARLGRDNVRAIATIIGSKTELEVQQYTQLLIKGVESKIQTDPPGKTMSLADIPAAMQISEECCEVLEKASDALLFHQEQYEVKLEKKKWGDIWLLTSEVSDWVEEQLVEGSSDLSVKGLLPAAELLKLRNWLELSTRIFMNAAAPDQNWHNLIEPGEVHGIRATAFGDFYRLARSITKKLVSATIFCAMSRLRATDPRSFNRIDMIKAKDVKAAVKTLGLELNSKNYWRNCPRRCYLDVYKNLQPCSVKRKPLTYNEVEAMLRPRRRSSGQSSGQSSEQSSRESSHDPTPSVVSSFEESSAGSETSISEDHELLDDAIGDDLPQDFDVPSQRDLASEYTNNESNEYGWPIDPSDSEFVNPGKRRLHALQKSQEREAAETEQIRHAEVLDIRASLREEQRLWSILKQEPPFAIKPEEFEVPDQPTQKRKELEEDWREKLEYRSEWEVLHRPLPIQKPQQNPNLLRRKKPSLVAGNLEELNQSSRNVDPQRVSHEDRSYDKDDHICSDGELPQSDDGLEAPRTRSNSP